MSKRKKKRSKRKQGLLDFAKDITFRGAASGVRVINNLIKGKPVSAIGTGLGAAATTVSHLVKAITGTNSKAWYTLYQEITPAENTNRPMDPIFNTAITQNPTLGNMARMFNFDVEWVGLTQSKVFQTMISNSYQLIRIKLKSNLPYPEEDLGAFLTNAIALAVAAKQLERDIHWLQYYDETLPDFQKLFKRRSASPGDYGKVRLIEADALQNENYASAIATYEQLEGSIRTAIKMPRSLAEFVSHYFGSVFVDSMDNKNDQYIIMNMHKMDWYNVSKSSDGKLSYTLGTIDVSNITADMLDDLCVQLAKQFGMILSDLTNSEQYVNLLLDKYSDYTYYKVYDASLFQAIQNAYTDDGAVQDTNYVRLDKRTDVEDDLTGYLFLGAINPEQAQYPGLTMLSMLAIYANDASLKWPISITQRTLDTASGDTDGAFVTFDDEYIGLQWVTTIPEDVYSFIYNGVNTTAFAVPGGFKYNSETDALSVRFTLTQDNGVYDEINYPNFSSGHQYLALRMIDLNRFDEAGNISDNSLAVLFDITSANGDTIQYTASFVVVPTSVFNGGGRYAGSTNPALTEPTVVSSSVPYTLTQVKRGVNTWKTQININEAHGYTVQVNYKTDSLEWTNYSALVSAGYILDVRAATYAIGDTIATTSAQTTIGYVGYAALGADSADFHLPILQQSRSQITFENGSTTNVVNQASSKTLLKEEYVPYWYNVLDLKPTLYNMFSSLFSPTNNIYEQLMHRKGEIAKMEKQRRKRDKDKASEPSNKD